MDKIQQPRSRRAARWTPFEVLLILLSAAMIVFPLFAEATRWISPPPAPAANRQQGDFQRVTASPESGTPTDVGAPTDAPTIVVSTAVPATAVPATTVPPTGIPSTPVPPTGLPGTAIPATPVPPTPVPPSATSSMGARLLTIAKSVSVSSAAPGEEFVYSISAFTGSATVEPVQVSDQVDGKLEVVSATSTNGSCTATQTVVCTINATNAGVLITLKVRGRANAAGSQVANSAAGIITSGANKDVTDGSETVYVNIEGAPVNATATRTSAAVTATRGTTPPTATSGPNPPTATRGTNQPTATNSTNPQPATTLPNQPTNSGDQSSSVPAEQQSTPTEPSLGPPPPDALIVSSPTPGVAAPNRSPTASRPSRPQSTVRASTQPRSATPATPTGESQATSQAQSRSVNAPTSTLTVATPDTGLYFRMASDWGSAYPEQAVNYVIAVRNTRSTGAANYTNLQISSDLPANLEVISAKSDRGGDPTINGNAVALKLASLAPGQAVEIVIETKVRKNVSAGTTIVGQASLTADGVPVQNYSNVVALLVVGAPAQQATLVPSATNAPATAAPVITTTAVASSAPSAPTAANAPTTTRTATTVATATIGVVNGPAGGIPPLPNTGTGVPLLGLALLGMTLLIRTIRLRRSQMRV